MIVANATLQNIFSLKRIEFKSYGLSFRKKAVFPLISVRAALCRRPALCLFNGYQAAGL